MRKLGLTIMAVAALWLPGAAPALQQAPRVAASAPADGRAVVAELRRIVAERYVLPERRPAIDAVLARGLSSGRYDVRDPVALAERINADLETIGDRHLNFRHDPRGAEIAAAGRREQAPDNSGFERQVRAANHGVSELRVLPGNVRYLAYDGFMWLGEESAAALDTAMRFLAGGDAVIIDLRRNGGGSPQAVQYLISHFLPADRPLVTFYMNGQAEADQLSTLAEVPAGRMVGKPLYVLISGGTGSAAEEFTGHVGGYRIGELVGANTGGAGFRNEVLPIAGQFMFSVSVGRAVLASTGRDWEAVGHAPTLPTEVPAALDAAHAHALRRLAGSAADPRDRARLEGVAEGVTARAEQRSPALPLAAYAGDYGERAIIAEDGKLYYRRSAARPRLALIALGGSRFALDVDPAMRLDFQIAGDRATAFEMAPAGAPSQGRFDRTR